MFVQVSECCSWSRFTRASTSINLHPSHSSTTCSADALCRTMEEAGSSSGRHPYAHLTTGRASRTIRTLDAFAFPAISPALSASSSSAPPSALEPRSEVKRRKVADVVSPSSEEAVRKRSSFSSIAGLDHVQRERARARRLRKANPKGEGSSSSSPATYQPFSREHLLSRLSTFTISSYTTKPAHHPRLSPLGIATRGWSQAGVSTRDEVRCVTCAATCHLESPPAAQSRDEKEEFWNRQESKVFDSHKSWCPWRLRGCDGESNPSFRTVALRADSRTLCTQFSIPLPSFDPFENRHRQGFGQ